MLDSYACMYDFSAVMVNHFIARCVVVYELIDVLLSYTSHCVHCTYMYDYYCSYILKLNSGFKSASFMADKR